MQVPELAHCEWIDRCENVIALGPSGTGKTHVALGLGLAACRKGLTVRFTTAAAVVHELMEARDERQILRLQKQMDTLKSPVCFLESGDGRAFTAAMRVGPLPGLWFGMWFRRGRAMPRHPCAPGTRAVSC